MSGPVDQTFPLLSGLRLGNLIRLVPLQVSELPSHPSFENHQTLQDSPPGARPELGTFIKAVLDEALNFVQQVKPGPFHSSGKNSSPPATSKVELLKHDIPGPELDRLPKLSTRTGPVSRKLPPRSPDEAWFARRSVHENGRKKGTSDFESFDYGLRADHSEHERQYTPDVFDSYKVLDWECPVPDGFLGEASYSDICMSIYEMAHKLPFPCSPRVFPVLVITAKTGGSSFIVVQIPVDIRSLGTAFYSNGRNVTEGHEKLKQKKPVLGVYTSIERGLVLEDGNIEWIMATASDAKGWLPMSLQKLGVPGAVIKDVGLFLQWISDQRKA